MLFRLNAPDLHDVSDRKLEMDPDIINSWLKKNISRIEFVSKILEVINPKIKDLLK